MKSKPSDETTATIFASAQGPAGKQPGDQAAANRNRINKEPIEVLLVDDHDIMRDGLKRIIEEEDGLTVIKEATNAENAIDGLKQTVPDVVIMDINLPGMSGIKATKIVKKIHPEIKVIGLSFHDENYMKQKMIKAGASAYLAKTSVSEKLCAVIKSEGRAG